MADKHQTMKDDRAFFFIVPIPDAYNFVHYIDLKSPSTKNLTFGEARFTKNTLRVK